MPCETRGYGPSERELHAMEATKLLCHLCGRLEKEDRADLITRDLSLDRWWKQHQAWDRERKASEDEATRKREAKDAALAKLTPDERRMLGVRFD